MNVRRQQGDERDQHEKKEMRNRWKGMDTKSSGKYIYFVVSFFFFFFAVDLTTPVSTVALCCVSSASSFFFLLFLLLHSTNVEVDPCSTTSLAALAVFILSSLLIFVSGSCTLFLFVCTLLLFVCTLFLFLFVCQFLSFWFCCHSCCW